MEVIVVPSRRDCHFVAPPGTKEGAGGAPRRNRTSTARRPMRLSPLAEGERRKIPISRAAAFAGMASFDIAWRYRSEHCLEYMNARGFL